MSGSFYKKPKQAETYAGWIMSGMSSLVFGAPADEAEIASQDIHRDTPIVNVELLQLQTKNFMRMVKQGQIQELDNF